MPKWLRTLIIVGGSMILFALFINLALPRLVRVSYKAPLGKAIAGAAISNTEEKKVIHLSTPEPVKALYMTSCVAGTPSWRQSLKEMINTTELNAVVIDIKDYTGRISFPNQFEKAADQRGCTVSDLGDFVDELHRANIYVIGRISVFQDLSYTKIHPELAVKSKSDGGVWKDKKGISFIDVGATPYWDYIIQISREAYALGFDELNYDYIRYPSDGDMQSALYSWSDATSTKAEMLEKFFIYLSKNLGDSSKTPGLERPVLSADLFGMTTTIPHDLGIGQVLEKALPYFDYIAPMVYPSHYPATWSGFQNPAEHPYEVIKIAMSRGREREVALNIANGLATSTPSKLRPWLQDFNLGATYGPDKVRAQIQATYDTGLASWMVWSAANKYTKEALLEEPAGQLSNKP